jgi:hypothetical protein
MYLNPKWVICEFLRYRLLDVREERRASEKTNSFTSTLGQDTFYFSFSTGMNLSSVKSLKVDSVELKKWRDYVIDFRNKCVVLNESLGAGEDVELTFYENNTDWIYWDVLNENLSPAQFPRISLIILNGVGVRLGNYKAPVLSTLSFQIDIYTKEKNRNQIFQIDGHNYTGEELAERISYDIVKAFEDYEDDLHPVFFDYTANNFPGRNMPFDETIQCHKRVLDCELSCVKVGRTD